MNNKTNSIRPFILDTDWWTDCDDCVAVRILADAEKKGKIRFLGANINAYMDISAYSLDLFLKEAGALKTEVAVDYSANDYNDKPENSYQCKIIETYGKKEDYETKKYASSVEFYRRLLSKSETKVDIVAVGFQNSLADLLKSTADCYSSLDGVQLVKEKVNKLWAMAGKWDENNGREYNLVKSDRSAKGGKYVSENWPTEITYLGYEVGEKIKTGGDNVIKDKNDILRIAMDAHGSNNGRSSWDPMTAMLAIIGDEEKAGYEAIRGTAVINNDGSNNFVVDIGGKHCYVKKLFEDKHYSDAINACL